MDLGAHSDMCTERAWELTLISVVGTWVYTLIGVLEGPIGKMPGIILTDVLWDLVSQTDRLVGPRDIILRGPLH